MLVVHQCKEMKKHFPGYTLLMAEHDNWYYSEEDEVIKAIVGETCPLCSKDRMQLIAESPELLKEYQHSKRHKKRNLKTLPDHYKGTQEAITIIEGICEPLEGKHGFLMGNVLKYALRAGKKQGSSFEEDIAKARNYAVRLVKEKWNDEE